MPKSCAIFMKVSFFHRSTWRAKHMRGSPGPLKCGGWVETNTRHQPQHPNRRQNHGFSPDSETSECPCSGTEL